jgi:formylmethanofuran dehydrogenase subunit E
MNIGPYTFEEFKRKTAEFHGCTAPRLLLGGYMMGMARSALPEDTLFEALVEIGKCLPDAVQLLSFCSTGNGRLKVLGLGRYALLLYDKHTGKGVRVHVDCGKITTYPELAAWFMKWKPKKVQNTDRILKDIESAGDNMCSLVPIQIKSRFLVRRPSCEYMVCPRCGESFPSPDGSICRGCQGEAPYAVLEPYETELRASSNLCSIRNAYSSSSD